jgi:hypothetical protein
VLLGAVGSSTTTAAPLHWDLWLFWPALGWAVAVITVGTLWARFGDSLSWRDIFGPLNHLSSNWSFSQSWAANLTTAATVLTGLFASSNVLSALLGSGTNQALTVMLVAGALATAFAGTGTVITATFKTGSGVIGAFVLLAAVITIGGTGGQLLVVNDQASGLALGGLTTYLPWFTALAGLLLTVYGVASIRGTLIGLGTQPKATAPAGARRRVAKRQRMAPAAVLTAPVNAAPVTTPRTASVL